ncbi:MAG: hypothetical protein QG575_1901 [Euryarchaeota archaeon]|nr:hypothetical protein [Euryarchaeota archaeon]
MGAIFSYPSFIGHLFQRLLHAISRCISWSIIIGIIVWVHVGYVGSAVSPVIVKEAVGFCHPHGLLVVLSSRAGAVVKGPKFTEAAIRKMAISVFGTSAMIHAVGFDCIFCLAGTGPIKS